MRYKEQLGLTEKKLPAFLGTGMPNFLKCTCFPEGWASFPHWAISESDTASYIFLFSFSKLFQGILHFHVVFCFFQGLKKLPPFWKIATIFKKGWVIIPH